MSQQVINIGTTANDGTGDPLRTALQKTNENFTEIYEGKSPIAGPGSSQAFSVGALTAVSEVITPLTDGVGITLNQQTGARILSLSMKNTNYARIFTDGISALALNEFGGNVLIGTTTDDGINKLQVNGSVSVKAPAGIGLYLPGDAAIRTNTTGLLYIDTQVSTGGNIQIRPKCAVVAEFSSTGLAVTGYLTASAGSIIRSLDTSGSGLWDFAPISPTDRGFHYYNGSSWLTSVLVLKPTGNVLIGTSVSATGGVAKCEVSGALYVGGAVACSDIRYNSTQQYITFDSAGALNIRQSGGSNVCLINNTGLGVTGGISASALPVYADNTAAAALATGTMYRTSTGVVMIKY